MSSGNKIVSETEMSHSGILSILHGSVSRPLFLWEKKVRGGYVKRVADCDLVGPVLEIIGNRLGNTYIGCPRDPQKTLGARFGYFNVTVKNVNRSFAFDVQILDDKEVRRRFCISTFFAVAEVKPFLCKLPLLLEEGWNQITLPLHETVRKAYRTNYLETLRVQIYSNCRLGRVYFSDRPYSEEELPKEFRLYQHCIKIRSSKVVNLSSPPSPTVDQAALYN